MLKKSVEVFDHIFWTRRRGSKGHTRHKFSAGMEVTFLWGRQSTKARIQSHADFR